MRKSICILLALLMVCTSLLLLSSCGNRDWIDTTYTYDYAIIELPNGEVVEGEVEEWRDYDGEQIQIKMKDGNIYLTSTYTATLVQTRNK